MTKQEAMERFSSGAVQQSLEIHRGIQWAGRIIGLVVCALIVKYMPSDWVERVWYYLLLLVILWTLHRLGESQAFICEKGLVLKRRPFSVKEYFIFDYDCICLWMASIIAILSLYGTCVKSRGIT